MTPFVNALVSYLCVCAYIHTHTHREMERDRERKDVSIANREILTTCVIERRMHVSHWCEGIVSTKLWVCVEN